MGFHPNAGDVRQLMRTPFQPLQMLAKLVELNETNKNLMRSTTDKDHIIASLSSRLENGSEEQVSDYSSTSRANDLLAPTRPPSPRYD